MPRPKPLAAAGTVVSSARSSRRCKCQSSGWSMVNLSMRAVPLDEAQCYSKVDTDYRYCGKLMPTKTAEINNITLLINRDLASHLALYYLMDLLKGHRISIFLSEKVGVNHSPPLALVDLAAFETQCLNDGRLTFAEMADTLGCKIGDFVDLENRLSSPVARDRIAQTNPDLILCIRFGLILPQSIIDLPKHGVINLHSGLLPDYRGVMATFRAMQNTDVFMGSTLHFISDPGIDCGAIIATQRNPINYNKSYLYNVLSLYRSGCQQMVAAVNSLCSGMRLETFLPQRNGRYYSFPNEVELNTFAASSFRLFDENELEQIDRFYS